MTLELTDQNFEKLTQNSSLPIVIDFWAQWCGPCKGVGVAINVLAEEYEGKAIIGKVDVDVNPALSLKFGVRNMPTVLYIKNGEVLNKQVGSTSKEVLEEKLKLLL